MAFSVESTLGISQILLGLALLIIPAIMLYFGQFEKKGTNALVALMAIGVAFILFTPGLIFGEDTGVTESLLTPDGVSWTVTASDAQTHVTEPSPNLFKVYVEYNQTGNNYNNLTEYIELTGSCDRADQGSEWARTTCTVTDTGEVTSNTAIWTRRDAISINTDGTSQFFWTDSASVASDPDTDLVIPRLNTLWKDTWSLNITLDSLGPDGMVLNADTEANPILISIGGTQITIVVIMSNIDNTGGTASP